MSVQYKLRHNFINKTAILTDVTNTYKNLHLRDMLLTLNKNILTKLLVWRVLVRDGAAVWRTDTYLRFIVIRYTPEET